MTSFGEDACGELFITTSSGRMFAVTGETAVADCNANGMEDGCETASGVAMDINVNATPDECECLGDATGNGIVDVTDLLELLAHWGPCLSPCVWDVNVDGSVGVTDLLVILGGWGPCP